MQNLPTWQKPIAWMIIALALPFVAIWQAYRKFRFRLWAARHVVKEYVHGSR